MYGASGKIKKIDGRKIIYDAPTDQGFSGSPILTVNRKAKNPNQMYNLVGIHSGGS